MRFLILLVGMFVNIAAVSAGGGEVSVESAYIREMPPGQQITAAFMRIVNQGERTCTLNGVASPVAERTEIHGHFHQGDVMQMRQVTSLAIKPGDTLVLKPGGYHVMLFGVVEKISDSEGYPLTLYFEDCPEVTVSAEGRGLLRDVE